MSSGFRASRNAAGAGQRGGFASPWFGRVVDASDDSALMRAYGLRGQDECMGNSRFPCALIDTAVVVLRA